MKDLVSRTAEGKIDMVSGELERDAARRREDGGQASAQPFNVISISLSLSIPMLHQHISSRQCIQITFSFFDVLHQLLSVIPTKQTHRRVMYRVHHFHIAQPPSNGPHELYLSIKTLICPVDSSVVSRAEPKGALPHSQGECVWVL